MDSMQRFRSTGSVNETKPFSDGVWRERENPYKPEFGCIRRDND